jgi:hypothetical protein
VFAMRARFYTYVAETEDYWRFEEFKFDQPHILTTLEFMIGQVYINAKTNKCHTTVWNIQGSSSPSRNIFKSMEEGRVWVETELQKIGFKPLPDELKILL